MKKLLIIVDFQNDFVSGSLGFKGAEKLIPIIKNKIEEYLIDGNDIIYTMDTHDDDYFNTLEGKKLPVKHCIKDTMGWEIVKECDYLSKAKKVFYKPTFPSLELGEYLKGKDYECVELCGLVSSICVLSNAVIVKASLPNTRIIVSREATSSYDLKLNEECFDILSNLHIEVI